MALTRGMKRRQSEMQQQQQQPRKRMRRGEDRRFNKWSTLPLDLLQEIMSRLELDDNVRASAVCKSWLESAVSVRVITPHPLLMHFPKNSDLYDVCDPITQASYILELPQLRGCVVRYCKEGWLLMHNPTSNCLFFFNPFTQERGDDVPVPADAPLPLSMAFSAAPTSDVCWLFTIATVNFQNVLISTFHVGHDSEWRTETHQGEFAFICDRYNQIIYTNDVFYCLSRGGWLAIFDPRHHDWQVTGIRPPGFPRRRFIADERCSKFLTEYEGNVLVAYTYARPNPKATVYRLDLFARRWIKMKGLGDLMIFGSLMSSETRAGQPGFMRSSLCVGDVGQFEKSCDSCGDYYMCEDCRLLWPNKFAWIDPPKKVSEI